uniref:Secreted protein n=1 Tax=Anguilla anguilla TaxID=7936 RepID=A0A0E9T8C8_ANGAN
MIPSYGFLLLHPLSILTANGVHCTVQICATCVSGFMNSCKYSIFYCQGCIGNEGLTLPVVTALQYTRARVNVQFS